MTYRNQPCLRIDASKLFEDPEFIDWMNSNGSLATWHTKGTKPQGYSDIFMTFDHGEGSDHDMPEHCWAFLCEVCKEAGLEYGLLWLTQGDWVSVKMMVE